MQLTARNITVQTGSVRVLEGLSLRAGGDEWLAVVGANGSGRSTLAAVLSGLRKPKSGHVCLDNVDIWSGSSRNARQTIGLVMQRAEDQFLGATVFDDVAFGPRQLGLDSAEVEAASAAALSMVGYHLEEVRDRSPLEFSGGQRRRLAVAGVLALNRRILVFDEPFAGLDADARVQMKDLVVELLGQSVTVVTLTSSVDPVIDATRLAVLHHGRIILEGTLDDLVADTDRVRQAGILLPENIQLACSLRQRGWNVPVRASSGELERAIAHQWRVSHSA